MTTYSLMATPAFLRVKPSMRMIAVCWPCDGAGGAFGDDFYNVTCAYVEFLHGSLVYAGDASADVSLSGISCA
jgi:hypothetical protein